MAGLFDYAATTPAPDPGQDQHRADGMQAYNDRQAEIEKARELMDVITRKLAEGQEPQYILYTAIRVIAILMRDTEWQGLQFAALDQMYGDLSQQNMFVDAGAVAAGRAEEKQREYAAKTLRKLQSSRKQADKLIEGLDMAINAAKALANEPDNPAAVERRPGR